MTRKQNKTKTLIVSRSQLVPSSIEGLEARTLFSAPGSGWQLAFQDNFDGTALDTSRWAVSTGARRDAINSASSVAVAGGNLAITTYTNAGKHYTGFIGSAKKFQATYGYYEARVAFNDSPGEWSAFWMQSPTMGNPIGDPATAGTEIDVAEHRAKDSGGANISNSVVSNLHWDGYGANHKSVGSGLESNPTSTPLQGNFHLYAVEWTAEKYTFYIDGVAKWSTTSAVSHRSEFIYLTSEVMNGSWAGSIPAGGYGSLASSTTKMLVDYVRVWQKPFSPIANVWANEVYLPKPIAFTVAQQDGVATIVSATSSNTALFPAGSLVISGTGADRVLTLTPAAGVTGKATITLTATGGKVTGTTTFTVNVAAGSFVNSGFEDGTPVTGWRPYNGAAITTTGQRSGKRAMKITGKGGAEQVITGLRPNTRYVLSGYAKETKAGVPDEIGVKFYGGPQLTAAPKITSYGYASVVFTTGATATSATIFVYKPTTEAIGYFDDLMLMLA